MIEKPTRPISSIGQILREIRREQGLSIAHISDISDVHPSTIAAFEHGKHTQLDSIEAISAALGYELDVLKIKD